MCELNNSESQKAINLSELISEIRIPQILTKAKDKNAPIAKEFKIKARFVYFDLERDTMIFETQDTGPQGSRRKHTTQIQLNGRKDRKTWDTRLKLVDLYEGADDIDKIEDYIIRRFLGTGNVNYGCSCECFTGDTLIKMLDGTNRRIDSLIPGEEYWIYSSDEAGNFIPKKAKALGVTKTVDQLVEVTLDNGEIVKCSLHHNWRLRDGSYRQAQELQPGDSLMPLYTELDDRGYEVILDNDGKKKNTHSVVNKLINADQRELKKTQMTENDKFILTHHVNFNKLDNCPENLEWMGDYEHLQFHNSLGRSKKGVKKNMSLTGSNILSSKMIERWQNDDFRNKVSNTQKIEIKKKWSDPHFVESVKQGREKDKPRLLEMNRSNESRQRTDQRNKTIEMRQAASKGLKKTWKNEKFRQDSSSRLSILVKDTMKKNPTMRRNGLKTLLFDLYDLTLKQGLELTWENVKKIRPRTRLNPVILFESFEESLEFYNKRNHKVISIRIIDVDHVSLYDINVPDTHNFALSAGVYVSNSFLYGGFMNFADRNKDNLTDEFLKPIKDYSEDRPPVKTNPREKGLTCKHVSGLLSQIRFFTDDILKAVEDELEIWSTDHSRQTGNRPPNHTKPKVPGQKQPVPTTAKSPARPKTPGRKTPVKTPTKAPTRPVKTPISAKAPKRPTSTGRGPINTLTGLKKHGIIKGSKPKFHKRSEEESPWRILNVNLNDYDPKDWLESLYKHTKKEPDEKNRHHGKKKKHHEKTVDDPNQVRLLQDTNED